MYRYSDFFLFSFSPLKVDTRNNFHIINVNLGFRQIIFKIIILLDKVLQTFALRNFPMVLFKYF